MEFLAIPIGVLIGILAGFFGVGGGFILTPILLLIGYAPTLAIATSLFYSIGTSVSGAAAHFRMKNIDKKEALILTVSGVAATQVAHPLVLWIEGRGWDDTFIPVLYLILLGYFALSMLFKKSDSPSRPGTTPPKFLAFVLIGFSGGLASTILGVGGGFVMVPLLISFTNLSSRRAVGTSLASIIFIVTSGFVSYLTSIEFHFLLGVLLVIGAVMGAQIGAKMTNYYENTQIRLFLMGLYLVIFLSVLLQLLNAGLAGLILVGGYAIVLFGFFLLKAFENRKTQK